MTTDDFSLLRTHFGFNHFRPGQQEAIHSLLEKNNTLVVMPTGAGKSLIFQLAALQLKGLTLVISPLIALMKDQVDGLVRRDIPATYINSTLSAGEQADRLEHLSHGDYRIVYVAPERLRSVPFLKSLQKQTVCLLAVDEAHCISEWGHDFRPDYLHIAQVRIALGNPLTIALTATATPQVQSDIIRLLGLTDAVRIVTGFNRPNLSLNVCYTNGIPAKLKALRKLFASRGPGAAILYAGTRRNAEDAAEFVRAVVNTPASYYHAGLPTEERTRIQNEFISGKSNIIAATNAFGMGIDRADVRQVIHYTLPGSLEAYYQEAGRAGRDGLPARVTLLYDPQDRALQEFFIQQSELAVENLRTFYDAIQNGDQVWTTLDGLSQVTGMHPVQIKVGLAALERAAALEHIGDEGYGMAFRKSTWNPEMIQKAVSSNKEHLRHRQAQLDHMITYAESNSCRRMLILKHFGDTDTAEALECCDNCQSRKGGSTSHGEVMEMTHGERIPLIILDCIRRIRFRVGRGKLSQILHGSKAQDILNFHHEKNAYYGQLAALKQSDIDALIGQLIERGYIKVIGGGYPVLSLTPLGENAVKQKEIIALALPRSLNPEELRRAKGKIVAGGTVEYTSQLLAQGLTPEQIAQQRGLTKVTVYGHCAKLIEAGKLDVEKVVPKDIREQIEKAIQKVGSTKHLWPIKDLLPGEITFEMIRCVLAGYCQPFEEPGTSDISLNEISILPDSHPLPSPSPDPIDSYLSSSHPRPLIGIWHKGFALDFHSSYTGAEWNRSSIGTLAYRLKYQSDPSSLPALVACVRDLFKTHPEMGLYDIILPVPSSAQREFEPVLEFCKALSRAFGKPFQPYIIKTRRTKPQKEMQTLSQKRANVTGAFAVKGDLSGKCVLVVDDLFDSGATLEEITRLLLKNGAARVNLLTLTRTIHSDL